jgi:hypothetical protein
MCEATTRPPLYPPELRTVLKLRRNFSEPPGFAPIPESKAELEQTCAERQRSRRSSAFALASEATSDRNRLLIEPFFPRAHRKIEDTGQQVKLSKVGLMAKF